MFAIHTVVLQSLLNWLRLDRLDFFLRPPVHRNTSMLNSKVLMGNLKTSQCYVINFAFVTGNILQIKLLQDRRM